jgi:hypothetical protein
MAGFGNTTNHGIAWNCEEGHSILKRFSEGHDSTPFIRGTEDIKSTPHKAAPQETSGMSPISKNQWKQMEQQISHTHSQNTEIRDLLIVTLGVNCFHSIELITPVSKTRTHWTSHSYLHCFYCHRINDRFWIEETSAGLRSRYPQWVWEMWEYEKTWEKAKKLIHEDTANIQHKNIKKMNK